MPFSEAAPAPQQPERIAEHEDNAAEAQVLGDRDIQTAKDRIISQFDTSTASITELHALIPEMRTAMDELIAKTVIRLVNVHDAKDLPPGKLGEIKEVVELRLEEFRKTVEKSAGKDADTAVAMAIEKKGLWFQERIKPIHNTHNDAEFTMSVEGKIQKPEAVTIHYTEKDPRRPKATMTVVTNERFFKPGVETVQGTLAARVQQNKETGTYRIEGTSDKIQNPEEFKKWIEGQLTDLSVNTHTASAEQLTRAAVDIVKKNLKIIGDPQKAFESLPQDQMPVDQLLQTGQEGVCRHFTVATRVVLEQIQVLTQNKQNPSLNGIVSFENAMNEMGHATLALARGDEVTTLDPFWYATGVQSTPDSTFDGRHGNITSLYTTLSKASETNPQGNVFDGGSSEKLVRELHADNGQIPKGVREQVDNPAQAIIMRTREIISNTELQTPENLLITVRSLHAVMGTLRWAEPEDGLALESIAKLSPLLAEVIELQKREAIQKGTQDSSSLNLAATLIKVGLNVRLERRNSPNKPEGKGEELIRTCEAAVHEQQLDQASQQEILETTAHELLYDLWQGIKSRLVQGKKIDKDGMYLVAQENASETDRFQKIEDATKTILKPTLQWTSNVIGFIKGKGLDKSQPKIKTDLEFKNKELGRVQSSVQGTFAERMAIELQGKFKAS